MEIKFKKNIASLCLLATLFVSISPLFAQKAEAQWVVWDPGNFVPNAATAINTGITAGATVSSQIKDYGLDAIAWLVANLIIERISASTVKWINSGFKGSPAFVTDPESYFMDLGDKIAGQFIFSNPNLNFLCSSFSARIKLVLTNNYRNERRWRCTLTDVIGNSESFMNDFSKGGWDKFFKLTQETQNNPIGAYLQAEGELFQKIGYKTGEKKDQLSWGKGFLSFSKCPSGHGVTDITPNSDGSMKVSYEDGTTINQQSDPELEVGSCGVEEEIATPGSVISEQLNKTLGLGGEKLVVADEINEIVSALLNQMISHIVGGIGSGLRGLSKPDSTTNNRVFLNQLTQSTATSTTDYFGNTQIDTIKNNTDAMQQSLPVINTNTNSGVPTNPLYPNGSNPTPFCNTGDTQCICQNSPGSSQCLACQNDPNSFACTNP